MTEVTISSKVGGKVTKALVEEGQVVKEGDLLAEFDHDELDAQISAAQAGLDVACLRNQKSDRAVSMAGGRAVSDSARQTQIDLANYNLQAAKANKDAAETNQKRLKQLIQAGLISQSQYDQAVTQSEVATAQYQALVSQVHLAKTSPNTDDLELVNRQSAAQIKQAETALALLLTQRNNSKVTAASRGVVSARLIEPGEVVSPGTPLFTTLDDRKPWVKIYLPLMTMEKLTLNQKATVKIDAFPKEKFMGRVAYISPEAEFTPKNYQTKEERVKQVYAVKIILDNNRGKFKAGMPVDVYIKCNE
jgi:HlyD family secretion protein